MARKVRYNGDTQSFYPCDDPKVLVKGQVYEVVSARDLGWQTYLTLKGVEGEFKSVWFEDVSPNTI